MSSVAELIRGLTFKVAGPDEVEAARALQRATFIEHHGCYTTDAWEDRARHFVIYDTRGELLATFRLVGPDQRPFDLEATVDLSRILEPGRAPALVGRLCIRRDAATPAQYVMLPAGVLKLAYDYSMRHGITDLLLYTYPKLLNFYRRAFFREFDMVDHEVWGRMHVMHLDLLGLTEAHRHEDTPLAKFLFRSSPPNFIV